MQRPPDRRSPLTLFTQGISEWISRLTKKHKQLVDLDLTAGEKTRLDRWAEAEFVYAALGLEDTQITREQSMRLVTQVSRATDASEAEHAGPALLDSLCLVESLARENGRAAELTPNFLINIHSVQSAGLRQNAGDTSRVPKPVAPGQLPAMLETACRWYTAESFAELNPVEQASIVFLRLMDLQPFDRANERTALVAASLFTIRSGLPPIIITRDLDAEYRRGLDEATRMNTKPLVELFAKAIELSLKEMIELIEGQRS